MDDDVFFDDCEVSQADQDRRFAEKEQQRRDKEQWNNGYLAGLECAEAHYLTLSLTGPSQGDFRAGVQAGLHKAKGSSELFEEAGRLK